jgi:hypothetical protein
MPLYLYYINMTSNNYNFNSFDERRRFAFNQIPFTLSNDQGDAARTISSLHTIPFDYPLHVKQMSRIAALKQLYHDKNCDPTILHSALQLVQMKYN